MYLRRKIDDFLDNWLKKEDKTPLLLAGIRQCGKTESIREFAKRNNLDLIELNFWNNPEFCSCFEKELNVDFLINKLSLLFPDHKFNHKNTLIFFDEIQDCPRARLSFKNFKDDGRYLVIGSGSYLGINGYVINDTTPIPIGYEEVVNMKTMDFEEFLWALGYTDDQIYNFLIKNFESKTEIPADIHNLFKDLFLKHASVSGFPESIVQYLKSKRVLDAFKITNRIVSDIKYDFGRRKDKQGNPVFKTREVSRIQSVFDLIPTFLSKENKRFIVSKIEGNNSTNKLDAIEYLKQSHIVSKVYNLNIPSLPLVGERIVSQFKLFPEEIGIVTSMYGIETLVALSEGNLGQGKGAIYEALIFDSLNKAGIDTFYFAKETGLEIDFVISYKGYATLIEAKAKTGNTKSSKTVMQHPEHYGKTKLIKIGDYNISEEGDIITIPHYLTFVLGKVKYDF